MNSDLKSKHGGKRPGAGRKPKEATSTLRVPESQKPIIRDFLDAYRRRQQLSSGGGAIEIIQLELASPRLRLPLYISKVPAGFPSPADDHMEKRIDLIEELVSQPDATFLVKVSGGSMIEAGLMPGAYAIVDRSREGRVGDRILAIVDGEFTIKILSRTADGRPLLLKASADPHYKNIEIKDGMYFEVWGVVTGAIQKF